MTKNCVESYSLNTYNGIPILSWYNDKNDTELKRLSVFLKYLSKSYDVRREIFKYVIEDTVIFDKVFEETQKIVDAPLVVEEKKNCKSNSVIPTEIMSECNESKKKKESKENTTAKSHSKNPTCLITKYNCMKVSDLKHFKSNVLNKKGLIKKKVCFGEKLSFSRPNNFTPVMKNNNEPTNSTLNYSILETTINKASQNSSNLNNKHSLSNSNNINIITSTHSSIHEKSSKVSKDLSSSITANRNSAQKAQQKEKNKEIPKSVLVNKSGLRTRNNNISVSKDSLYFNTEENCNLMNFHTILNDPDKIRRNTPLYDRDRDKYKSESRLKNFDNINQHSEKNLFHRSSLFNSFSGNKKDLKKTTSNYLKSGPKKQIKAIKKKHNNSLNEEDSKTMQKQESNLKNPGNNNQIMSLCRELLQKNEEKISAMFSRPKCHKKVASTLFSKKPVKK